MDLIKREYQRCCLEANIHRFLSSLEMVETQERLAKLTLYCTDVHENSDMKHKTKFQRIHALDEPLCELWDKLLNPLYVISRVYTPTPPRPVRTVYVEKEKESSCVMM